MNLLLILTALLSGLTGVATGGQSLAAPRAHQVRVMASASAVLADTQAARPRSGHRTLATVPVTQLVRATCPLPARDPRAIRPVRSIIDSARE